MGMHDAQLDERLRLNENAAHSLGDRVYEVLRDAIVEEQLEPGDRLSDKEIADVLGASRTPVREALQRLAWIGLVEVSPSRYTRVTEVSDELAAGSLEYTGLHAGLALQLAVRRMDDADLAEAVSLLDRMIAASAQDDADGGGAAPRAQPATGTPRPAISGRACGRVSAHARDHARARCGCCGAVVPQRIRLRRGCGVARPAVGGFRAPAVYR